MNDTLIKAYDDQVMQLQADIEQLNEENAELREILESVYKWWTETPAFADGEDEMPAEIFDDIRAAISRNRNQQVDA